MESESFKYYAFISYSHKDKDIAQRLHKRLRSYHLPSKLIETHPELPKKLGSIFLDEANLVAKDGSLTESLKSYLDDSNYLILICSPDSAKSKYVNEEVEYFMKIGRRKHIVPLIISGLPHSKDLNAECFVPAILNLPFELEPLGIDFKTYGERDAFLRVIATTLGLDLDNFISIEARERRRKAIIFSSIAAAFMLITGLFVKYHFDSVVILEDSKTQLSIANKYYSEKNYAKAMEWYQKAAVNGDTNAQFNIGIMYEKGEGVEKDYVKAMEWYQKAADNGNANAQNRIGYMYTLGLGVKQDYAKAMECYEKAADNGLPRAYYHLGEMYQNGQGVEQDYAKAAEYYKKAAENGDPEAQKALDEINKKGLE